MTKNKKKKPTINDLAQSLVNIDAGLRGLSNILKIYMEYKGDLIMFNQYLAEKQKEHQEKVKENDGNTD